MTPNPTPRGVSQYTPEQVERMHADVAHANRVQLPLSTAGQLELEGMLRAYAATLRQQGGQTSVVDEATELDALRLELVDAIEERDHLRRVLSKRSRVTCSHQLDDAVAELIAAGDFLAMNGTDGMVRRWERAKAALAQHGQPREAMPAKLWAWLDARYLTPDADEDGTVDEDAIIQALNDHEDALMGQHGQQGEEQAVAYWAAISDDGEIVVAYPADDGNSGEAARTECNQYINDALLNDRVAFHLVPLYTHPAPPASPASPAPPEGGEEGAWPKGCIKPNSCSRHRACVYGTSEKSCRHFGTDIGPAIDLATAQQAAR